MELLYDFDFVHDTQRVFRKILDSLSKPGKVCNISSESNNFNNEHSHLLAIGCSLLDNEVSVFVEKTPKLENSLVDLTLVKRESLSNADFIFITAPMNYNCAREIMLKAKKGTFKDPHTSATIVILCDEILGNKEVKLKGPGIDGVIEINTTDYIENIIRIKQENRDEYPCGIDIIFADESGGILGIPRLCKML